MGGGKNIVAEIKSCRDKFSKIIRPEPFSESKKCNSKKGLKVKYFTSCLISSIEEEVEVLQSSHRVVESLSLSRQATIVGAARNRTKNSNTILARLLISTKIADTN